MFKKVILNNDKVAGITRDGAGLKEASFNLEINRKKTKSDGN